MSRIKTSLDKMNRKKPLKNWPLWLFVAGSMTFAFTSLFIAGVFDKTLQYSDLQLALPEQQTITPHYRLTGKVHLHQQRILIARTPGTVESILISPGSKTTAGTTLAKLINLELQEEVELLEMELSALNSELALRIQRAEQRLQSQIYEVELAKGNAEMERARLESETTLHEINLVSDIDFNVAKLRAKQAEIELLRQQQEQSLAKQELTLSRQSAGDEISRLESRIAFKQRKLSELTIIAPEEMTVLELDNRLSLGAALDAGAPLLSYYKSGDLGIRVLIPPSMLSRINVGQQAVFSVGNITLAATVIRIGARVEGGSLPVWLAPVEPVENYATEGQDVPVELTLSSSTAPFVIPTPAWYRGPGNYEIYCYRHELITPCDIELGYTDGQLVEVFTELAPSTLLEVTSARRWLGDAPREVQQ